jgi:hypothetical protein
VRQPAGRADRDAEQERRPAEVGEAGEHGVRVVDRGARDAGAQQPDEGDEADIGLGAEGVGPPCIPASPPAAQ